VFLFYALVLGIYETQIELYFSPKDLILKNDVLDILTCIYKI